MRLLIGYDGQVGSEAIFEDLMRAGLPPKLEAEVMTIRDLPPAIALGEAYIQFPGQKAQEYFREEREALAIEAHQIADQAAARLRRLFPGWAVDTNTAFGSPHRQLVHRAEAWPADLLAVASHGRGAMGRLFFGSVAQACLHHCRRSVRICRTPDDSRHLVRPPRLLLATDGSAAAQEARRVITIRRWPRGTTVRVLSLAERTWMPGPDDDPSDPSRAQSPADARQTARRCAEEEADLLNTAGCSAHAVSYDGYPRRDIAADALREDVDAIFLGAVGHPLVERLLIGSVAASVAARAHCSVEIVRPPS